VGHQQQRAEEYHEARLLKNFYIKQLYISYWNEATKNIQSNGRARRRLIRQADVALKQGSELK